MFFKKNCSGINFYDDNTYYSKRILGIENLHEEMIDSSV